MKNFVQQGEVLDITAPYTLTSGLGCLVGAALFGVAIQAASSGAAAKLYTEGVFDLAKTTGAGENPAPGARVYWDNTNKRITTTSTSNTEVGIYVGTSTAGTGDTTIRIKIPKTI
jgi:predicted RecA/RadA family phage recombinase